MEGTATFLGRVWPHCEWYVCCSYLWNSHPATTTTKRYFDVKVIWKFYHQPAPSILLTKSSLWVPSSSPACRFSLVWDFGTHSLFASSPQTNYLLIRVVLTNDARAERRGFRQMSVLTKWGWGVEAGGHWLWPQGHWRCWGPSGSGQTSTHPNSSKHNTQLYANMFLREANSKVLEKPKSPWKMIGDMCEVGEGLVKGCQSDLWGLGKGVMRYVDILLR